MCVRSGTERPRSSSDSTSESQKLNKVWANPKDLSLGTFLKRVKKSPKGSAKSLSRQILCIFISPTTGWATGQTENARCVNRICVNALLTLTALIYIYISAVKWLIACVYVYVYIYTHTHTHTVEVKSLHTPCRICKMLIIYQVRGIIQNAWYCLFSTDLNNIFHIKDVLCNCIYNKYKLRRVI